LTIGNSKSNRLGARGAFKKEKRETQTDEIQRDAWGYCVYTVVVKMGFSLDASFGLLATASASALAVVLGSALCCCGVSCYTPPPKRILFVAHRELDVGVRVDELA